MQSYAYVYLVYAVAIRDFRVNTDIKNMTCQTVGPKITLRGHLFAFSSLK